MRKHSPRKWLHAVLDLLPLIIIPIFAIYSHRHTIDSYSVTIDESKYANFYQGVINGKPITLDNWDSDIAIYIDELDDENYVYIWTESSTYINTDIQINTDDLIYLSFTFYVDPDLTFDLSLRNDDSTSSLDIYSGTYIEVLDGPQLNSTIVQSDITFNADYIEFYYYDNYDLYLKDFQLFNLTSIFGAGNEPTKDVFESYLIQDYYDFGDNTVQISNDIVTYDNTDIGSQFVYALYTPIHDYFNLSQVGVFGQLYDFLQVNMFNGKAPISIFIVYHVILYEFIMDLIFLIYCVFMFIIDFAEKMLDSFFDKSFGGGKR